MNLRCRCACERRRYSRAGRGVGLIEITRMRATRDERRRDGESEMWRMHITSERLPPAKQDVLVEGMYESQLRIRWHLVKVGESMTAHFPLLQHWNFTLSCSPITHSLPPPSLCFLAFRHAPFLLLSPLPRTALPFPFQSKCHAQDSTTGAWLTSNVSVIRPGPI